MPRLILLAHGSPDPRHRAGVDRIMAGVAAELSPGSVAPDRAATTQPAGPWSVSVAYLQHHGPDLAGAMTTPAPPHTTGPTVVQPLLLTGGEHERHDVPAALPGATTLPEVTTLPGISPPELLPAVCDAIAAARARSSPGNAITDVVLVAAGSRTADLAGRFKTLPGALARAPECRDLADARFHLLDRPTRLMGHVSVRRATLVVPLLIAPGRILDRISTAADAAGTTVGPAVGQTPAFARLLAARAVSALNLGHGIP